MIHYPAIHCPRAPIVEAKSGAGIGSYSNRGGTLMQFSQKFQDYAVGEINEMHERYNFNKRRQEDATFENFYSNIRTLVKTCNYCEQCVDSMLPDRIVLGIRNTDTQTELLKVRNLSRAKCVDICKTSEKVAVQIVDKIRLQRPTSRGMKQEKELQSLMKQCKFYGGKYKLRKEESPAFKRTCQKGREKNYFACCCASMKRSNQKKSVHQVVEDTSSDGEWIHIVNPKPKKYDVEW